MTWYTYTQWWSMMCFHSKISLLEGKCLVDMIIQRSNVGAIIPAIISPREGFPQNASCSLLWNPRACHQIGIPTSPPFLCLYLYLCIYIYGRPLKKTYHVICFRFIGGINGGCHPSYIHVCIYTPLCKIQQWSSTQFFSIQECWWYPNTYLLNISPQLIMIMITYLVS